MKFTEEDLKKMLSQGAKIASVTPSKSIQEIDKLLIEQNKKIDLSNEIVIGKTNKKTKINDEYNINIIKDSNLGVKVKDSINKINKNCLIEIIEKDNYCVLIFKGAKMLSLNQILALLQLPKKKYEAFAYKKLWHELTQQALEKMTSKYNFDNGCDILVYRSAPRLVDNDSLAVMFKFIIDAVKKDKKDINKKYILTEDDPQFVKNIKVFQEKSKENIVAIRFQNTQNNKNISFNDFCKKEKI